MTQRSVPMSFKARRFVILLQLAFVGLLLMGRIAAGVVDASGVAALGSANMTGPANSGVINEPGNS